MVQNSGIAEIFTAAVYLAGSFGSYVALFGVALLPESAHLLVVCGGFICCSLDENLSDTHIKRVTGRVRYGLAVPLL